MSKEEYAIKLIDENPRFWLDESIYAKSVMKYPKMLLDGYKVYMSIRHGDSSIAAIHGAVLEAAQEKLTLQGV